MIMNNPMDHFRSIRQGIGYSMDQIILEFGWIDPAETISYKLSRGPGFFYAQIWTVEIADALHPNDDLNLSKSGFLSLRSARFYIENLQIAYA